MLRGNTILCAKYESNAQHGRRVQKCSKIFFSRTGGPIFTKFDMQYLELQPIVFFLNCGPRMTLANFTARSVLATYACRWYFGSYCSLRPENGRSRH